VHYNIYYSVGGQVNFATATKLSQVVPSLPANYAAGTGYGIYPYCYTVTGLKNGLTYSFAIRAQDSCAVPHEDTNAVSISTVVGTNALSTFKKITIDGSFADWTGVPWSYLGATDTNPVNFIAVQFVNDTNHLSGHIKLASPYPLFTDYYTHVFFDTDTNASTGYQITGALFGSEMMIESGFGYDQRNGSFNAGSVSSLGWAIAPTTSATEFEFQVSLAALYPDSTKVFRSKPLRLLLQDDRGPENAVETGIPYAISPPQLGPLFIAESNVYMTITWAGPGTLQSSTSLANLSWTNLSNAASPYTFQAGAGQQFFRLSQ
jgi:hypothetical protein